MEKILLNLNEFSLSIFNQWIIWSWVFFALITERVQLYLLSGLKNSVGVQWTCSLDTLRYKCLADIMAIHIKICNHYSLLCYNRQQRTIFPRCFFTFFVSKIKQKKYRNLYISIVRTINIYPSIYLPTYLHQHTSTVHRTSLYLSFTSPGYNIDGSKFVIIKRTARCQDTIVKSSTMTNYLDRLVGHFHLQNGNTISYGLQPSMSKNV